MENRPKRACKIQCIFDKNIAPLFAQTGPPPLGSKKTQQLSDGVGCWFGFHEIHLENVVLVLKK